jgi:hypothetical protein
VSWTIPRLWPGKTVAILAPGPSLKKATADLVQARGLPTIAVTSAAPLAPWADMIYAADEDFWRINRWAFDLPGMKVGMCSYPGVLELAISRRTEARGEDRHNGFDPDPSRLRTGGNSGYQALSIAVHAGAAKILLFGFDMGGTHWHGEYPAPLRNTHPDQFAKWIERFRELAPLLLARRIDVVNCSPTSALDCFRKQTPEEALCEQ